MNNMTNSFWKIALSLKEYFSQKSVISFFISFITILTGVNFQLYESIIILLVLDLITGLMRSVRRRKRIRSYKLINTIKKFILYTIFLISAHQLVKISSLLIWVDEFSASFLAITEMLSIIENLSQAGILIPKWFIKKLQKYIDTGEFK